VRTFVALNLEPSVRTAIHDASATLRELLGRGVSWVAEPSLHVTLRFLGDRQPSFVDALRDRLTPALATHRPVVLDLASIGAFPSLRRPRVLWWGIASNPAVARLYHDVEDACTSLGVEREGRAFHPHVTLGRVRDGASLDLRALERQATEVSLHVRTTVLSVDVMESVLGPGGARYRVAASVPLGSSPPHHD
jgi:RNA 2',3'-cyclic 3'-phosphodiesterase